MKWLLRGLCCPEGILSIPLLGRSAEQLIGLTRQEEQQPVHVESQRGTSELQPQIQVQM